MKIAVVSDSLPPAGTGQGMLIYRMLEGLSPESYCLISTLRYDSGGEGYARKLPGRYYHLAEGSRLKRGHRFGLAEARLRANFALAVLDWARQIAEIVRRERCEAIVAFTGDPTHLPAAWLAGRRAGVPFFAYVVDHYSYREWHTPSSAFWARLLEPRLMRGAAGVIVLNEFLRDDLRDRFGVEAEVIYNSFDLSPYGRGPEPRAAQGGARVVFTGAIYEAHYDAFHNLMAAFRLLGREDIKLHVYTALPPEWLTRAGLGGPLVHHPSLALEEVPPVQRAADILFLPLAFNSPYPGVIKTSQPTKMGEYMAARRPVLVHAPPDSYIAWYFRRHRCGLVVDRLEPAPLAEALARALTDADLREGLAARAWERAREDFDIAAARAKFWDFLARGRSRAARA